MPEPIYTAANCTPAYELRWSLAIFSRTDLPATERWLRQLKPALERDHVRSLETHWNPREALQFLLSTKPSVAPSQIIKSAKGRLQNLLNNTHPRAFRRNYWITSVGQVRRDVVENYVAQQLGHHRIPDANVQDRLAEFQLEFPDVDLGEVQCSSHGRYIYNLHSVIVHDWR